MNVTKLILTSLVATAAWAQSSPTANTSTVSAADVKAQSKWSASFVSQLTRPADVATAESEYDTLNILGLKYRLSENRSLTTQIRFGVYQELNKQTQVEDYTTRLVYGIDKVSIAGSDPTSILLRATLPTNTVAREQKGHLTVLSVASNINWSITPVIALGYSGVHGASFYYKQNLTNGKPADQQDFAYTSNSAVATVTLSDVVSFYQKIGHDYTVMDRSKGIDSMKTVASILNVETGVSFDLTKKLNISMDITQAAPIIDGSIDVISGKALSYSDTYALYRANQTSYQFAVSYAF